ncbi:hypothetical protein E2542_SST09497 [Spatholobus suberectus]|nr:hypothetical protein E2542_SST09497 [Spatholobus suberectus]
MLCHRHSRRRKRRPETNRVDSQSCSDIPAARPKTKIPDSKSVVTFLNALDFSNCFTPSHRVRAINEGRTEADRVDATTLSSVNSGGPQASDL